MQKILRDTPIDGSRIVYQLDFKSLTHTSFQNLFTRKKSLLNENYRAPLLKFGKTAPSIITTLLNNDAAVHELAITMSLLKSNQVRKRIDPRDLSLYNFTGTANGPEGPGHFYHASQLNYLQDAHTALEEDHARMIRYFKHFQGFGGMLDVRKSEDAAFLAKYHDPFLPASGRRNLKDGFEETFRQRESAFEASGVFPPGGHAHILIGDSVVRVQTQGGLATVDANGVVRSGQFAYVTAEPTHVFDGGAFHYQFEVAENHVMSGVVGVGKSNSGVIDWLNVFLGEPMWPIQMDVGFARDYFLNSQLRGEIPHTQLFDDYLKENNPQLFKDVCASRFVLKADVFGIWWRKVLGPWAPTNSTAEFVKVYKMNGTKDLINWDGNPLSHAPQGERTVLADLANGEEWGIYVGEKKLVGSDTLNDLSKETEMKKIMDDAIADAIDDTLSSDKLRELNKNQQDIIMEELRENPSSYLDSSIDRAVETLMTDPRIVEPASSLFNELKDATLPALVDDFFNTLSETVPAFKEKLYTRIDIDQYIDRQLREQYLPKYTSNDPLLQKDVEIAVLNAQDNVADVTKIKLADELKKLEAIEAKENHDLDVLRREKDAAIKEISEAREKALEVKMKELEELKETRKEERLEKQSVFDEHEKERLEHKQRIKNANNAREKLEQERKGGAEHRK